MVLSSLFATLENMFICRVISDVESDFSSGEIYS